MRCHTHQVARYRSLNCVRSHKVLRNNKYKSQGKGRLRQILYPRLASASLKAPFPGSTIRTRVTARTYRFFQSPVEAKASAIRIKVASSKCLPTNITPIGKPPTMPHGTVKAGFPATSKGQVLCCMLSASVIVSSREQSESGSFAAGNGIVGMAMTS